MKQWKCEQCEYSSRFKRQKDIRTPLPDGMFCTVYKKIIEDDDNECKYYCVASYLM